MQEQESSPLLCLDRNEGRVISQQELAQVALLEEKVRTTHAALRERLQQGAAVEPGALIADAELLSIPVPAAVRDTTSASAASRISGKTEPSFDGGLTFAEQRMLRNLQIAGVFDARRLLAIVDRLERIADELFADEREQMAVSAKFTMGDSLKRRLRLGYYLRRARLMIWLHDWGVTRVRQSLVAGMFDLNRVYFAVRSPQT